jgi:dTDP-glucose 4,6-dehydratase
MTSDDAKPLPRSALLSVHDDGKVADPAARLRRPSLDAAPDKGNPASRILEVIASRGGGACLRLAAEHGARYLLASTSEVYGDPLVHPQPETYWGNVNPIGSRSVHDECKRFAEALSMAWARERGVDVVIVRIFNTYGPRLREDDGRVVPNFILQALTGRPLTVYGDGRQTRSVCYQSDLITGLVAMLGASPGR